MNRKAIILVAGKGTRLAPRTEKVHKCLTEVKGRAIVDNALQNLSKVGVEEVVLVVGYLASQIQKALGDEKYGMKLKYVENTDYAITNTTASLQYGFAACKDYDEVILLEGDVFFEEKILRELIAFDNKDVSVLEPYNEALEGSFAELDKRGYICDWRHKSTQGEDYKIWDKYKTVNIHRFSHETIRDIIVSALEEDVFKNKGKNPLEYVMRTVVNSHPGLVAGFVLSGQKWVEIDDENDLKRAEEIF